MSPTLANQATPAKTILLVEDEVLIAFAEARYLEKHGFRVVTVTSGEKAIETVRQRDDIDLILMDINLGRGMDGTKAAEIILRERTLPVVFLSSHTSQEVVEKTEKITSYGYVVKHSGETVLIASIRMAFKLFDAHCRLQQREADLRRNIAILEASQQLSKVGGWEWDVARGTTFWTDETYRIHGFSPDDIPAGSSEHIGHSLECYDPEDRPLVLAAFERCISQGIPYDLELPLTTVQGERLWVRTTGRAEWENGQVVRVVGTFMDISERKQTEAALQASEERIRTRLNAILDPDEDIGDLELADIIDLPALHSLLEDFHRLTHIGVGILDLKGQVLVATGWQDICLLYHQVHPATRENCMEMAVILSNDVQPGTFEIYRCKNHMRYMATPIIVGGRHAGKLIVGQFFFEDETPDYDAFRRQARLYGFDEQEYLAAVERAPRWSRETVKSAMAIYGRLAAMIANLSHSNLKLARTLAERDALVASLRSSREQYRLLIEHPGEAVMVSQDGLIKFINTKAAELAGRSREELNARQFHEFIHPEDQALALNQTSRRLEGVDPPAASQAIRFLHGSGSVRWAEPTAVPIEWDGRPALLYIIKDVTDQVQARQFLQQNKLRFDRVQRIARIGSWEWDVVSGHVDWSDGVYRVFGLQPGEETPSFELARAFVHPDDLERWETTVADALADGDGFQMDYRAVRSDGQAIWIHNEAQIHRGADKAPLKVAGTAQDITNRKLAEEALAKALTEKSALLSELQHRVKNSLSMIISLAALEAGNNRDPVTKQALETFRDRISAIADIYHMLYSSEDVQEIRLDEYFLRIAQSLTSAHLHPSQRVILDTQLEPVNMDLKRASALGLILNELLTNALKYAFPDGRDGTITLRLERREKEVVMEVSDNGAGIPDGHLSESSAGLGIKLVRLLTNQYYGSLALSNTRGVRAVVRIPYCPG